MHVFYTQIAVFRAFLDTQKVFGFKDLYLKFKLAPYTPTAFAVKVRRITLNLSINGKNKKERE